MFPSIDDEDWVHNPRLQLFFPATAEKPFGDDRHWQAFINMLIEIDSNMPRKMIDDWTDAARIVADQQHELTHVKPETDSESDFWRQRLGGIGADPQILDSEGTKGLKGKTRHAFLGHRMSDALIKANRSRSIQQRKGEAGATREAMDLAGRATQPHYEQAAMQKKQQNLTAGFFNGRQLDQGNAQQVVMCERTRFDDLFESKWGARGTEA